MATLLGAILIFFATIAVTIVVLVIALLFAGGVATFFNEVDKQRERRNGNINA